MSELDENSTETAHMPLDEEGLEAAEQAHTACTKFGCKDDHCNGLMCRSIIRAYLQTAAADVSGLVADLRDEDFRHEMQHLRSSAEIDRLFQQSASTLQTLSASNAALEAENARLRQLLKDVEDSTDLTTVDGHLYDRVLAALSAHKGGQTWGEWERSQQEAGS